MKTIIETSFKSDSGKGTETFSVILDMEELTRLVASNGHVAANKALDTFVEKYVHQFKEKFAGYLAK